MNFTYRVSESLSYFMSKFVIESLDLESLTHLSLKEYQNADNLQLQGSLFISFSRGHYS